jgi:hypothetical protein
MPADPPVTKDPPPPQPATPLSRALALIDAANSADPTLDAGTPAARLYGQRMTAELDRVFPNAPDVLQIAARGQHVERWLLPRADYPLGRDGYLALRREQGRRHALRVAQIMAQAGYGTDDQDRVGPLLRKEGLKRDGLVQALEDVICLVFLRWYFQPFAGKHTAQAVQDIVEKTARKMSDAGRARVRAEFDLPPPLAAAFGS